MLDSMQQGVPNGVNGTHATQNGEKVNGHSGQKSELANRLVLDHPTTAENQAQAKSNGASWRAALSIEAYLRREDHLATQGLTKDGGITYWVLVDPKQDKKPRDVLAGCETYRKRAIVSRDGELQDVIAHGVGSVFTPPSFRGHGYGAIMMQKLATELEHWQADDKPCLFSILYSDIGKLEATKRRIRQLMSRYRSRGSYERKLTRVKKFYDKNGGWVAFPSSHIHLRPERPTNGQKQAPVKPLYEDDLPGLCAADEAMVRSDMAKRQQGTAVALLPDHKTIEWHHARENFVSNELYGKRPMVKGAMTQVGEDRIWTIFTRVWQNEDPTKASGNTLYILRLVVEDRKQQRDPAELSEAHVAAVASLLRFAQHEAYEWTMGEVELWNPRPAVVEAARMLDPKVHVEERETDSVCAMRWYGASNTKVDWLECEKYGWC